VWIEVHGIATGVHSHGIPAEEREREREREREVYGR
jgi:hypothetical protein